MTKKKNQNNKKIIRLLLIITLIGTIAFFLNNLLSNKRKKENVLGVGTTTCQGAIAPAYFSPERSPALWTQMIDNLTAGDIIVINPNDGPSYYKNNYYVDVIGRAKNKGINMIPNNHIEIEVEIDDDGNFKRTIVGHGANTGCHLENDEELLKELFIDVGDIQDSDVTDDHFGQKKNPIKPIASSPNNGKKGGKKDKITLGFGI